MMLFFSADVKDCLRKVNFRRFLDIDEDYCCDETHFYYSFI